MVVVVLAVMLLSIVGSLTLLVAVSSLEGAVNMKPEDRAFQIAESGLSVAHAKIIGNTVPPDRPYTFSGTAMGGTYTVSVLGNQPLWTVFSQGEYVDGTNTYKRKLQEDLGYRYQVFDAMRRYMMVAGNSIIVDVDDIAYAGVPIVMNGSLHAQNSFYAYLNPLAGIGDGMTVNGSLEAENNVYLESVPGFTGQLCQLSVNGDLRSNRVVALKANGTPDGMLGWIDVNNIYTGSITKTMVNGTGIDVHGSETTSWSGVPRIQIPEPNFAYYKSLAMEQGHYYDGSVTFNGNRLSEISNSSLTVVYSRGSITLNGYDFDKDNMKAVFVTEGHFNATGNLSFSAGSKFQAIAKGNATFNCTWDFRGAGYTDEFFIWSGNDATVNLGMFQGSRVQLTSRNDVNVNSDNMGSICEVSYGVPDIDIGGFPVDMTVYSWKELIPD